MGGTGPDRRRHRTQDRSRPDTGPTEIEPGRIPRTVGYRKGEPARGQRQTVTETGARPTRETRPDRTRQDSGPVLTGEDWTGRGRLASRGSHREAGPRAAQNSYRKPIKARTRNARHKRVTENRGRSDRPRVTGDNTGHRTGADQTLDRRRPNLTGYWVPWGTRPEAQRDTDG